MVTVEIIGVETDNGSAGGVVVLDVTMCLEGVVVTIRLVDCSVVADDVEDDVEDDVKGRAREVVPLDETICLEEVVVTINGLVCDDVNDIL